ncbi:MAG: hypothetical protein ABIP20_00910 [Chthoniobacteraceae bacterium]
MAAAETHWAEAVRLKPDDDACRLPLAIIRLNSKDPELRNSARAVLTEISRKPPRRTQALRVLIADAMKNVDYAGVVELSDALVADPAVTFDDKLIRLRAIRSIRLRESASYLEELRDAALPKPGELYVLLMWMNENDLALLVQDWARTCLQDVIIAPPVSVAVADAYVRSSEWAKLCEFTDERDWADSDYLRRAFRARAWERLGDGEKSSQEWTDALSLARGHKDAVQCQERLARVAIAWGWKQRAQEVMWSMAGSPACPRWILNTLWNYAIINSDAPQLQRLAGIIVQRDSKSVTLRNNFAFYSLLVRSENGDAHGEAERLSNGNPGNADIALTRALSLHQQGRSAEAVTLTGSLPAEELKRPQFALYHSIFLTAAGDGGKAAAFLPLAEGRKMFPEEKTMLERARQSVAKAAGEQEVAERSKAMRAAKTGTDLDMEKAIEAARVVRAAKLAKESEEAKVTEAARAAKAEAAKEAQAAKDAVAPPPFVAR